MVAKALDRDGTSGEEVELVEEGPLGRRVHRLLKREVGALANVHLYYIYTNTKCDNEVVFVSLVCHLRRCNHDSDAYLDLPIPKSSGVR